MEAIILLGGPGAGKGTLAEILKNETDYVHVSTGDMLRAAIYAGTPVGKQAQAYMDKGQLVPDEVVLGIIEERIIKDGPDTRFMFDGFPRTLAQAEGLGELFRKHSGTIDHVFKLDVPNGTLIRRLGGRRVCKTCNAVYHVINKPPMKPGVCDVDGGELYQRADDCEETILNRLEVYEKQTAPLVDYYRSQELLRDIDASGSIEKTAALVLNILHG